MDFAMLDPTTPSSTWDPKARRCRNPLGRFTGPPTNAAAAARLLESYGYTVTIQPGRRRRRKTLAARLLKAALAEPEWLDAEEWALRADMRARFCTASAGNRYGSLEQAAMKLPLSDEWTFSNRWWGRRPMSGWWEAVLNRNLRWPFRERIS